MKQKLIVAVMAIIFTSVSQAAVWPSENQWNEGWETEYKQWLGTNAHIRMFADTTLSNGEPNPYYGIRADCADTVYSLRIIFSYENNLPFAMNNPARDGDPIVSNEVSRFDKEPAGAPRLKKFLRWIQSMVSTHRMPRDTYSVGFDDVSPGTIILTTRKNHHSWTIIDISKSGNPHLIFNSTVGRESGLMLQERQSWPNPSWIFEPEVDKNGANVTVYKPGSYAGFRYWRPQQYLQVAESAVPGYSEEQHEVGISKWKSVAQNKLAQVKETIDQVVSRLLKDACSDFKQRIDAVAEAEVYKKNLAADFAAGKTSSQSEYVKEFMSDPKRPSDNRCMIYSAFDQHSTPSRDKRLIDAIMLARAYYKVGLEKYGPQAFAPEHLQLYNSIFPMIESSASAEARGDRGGQVSNYCSFKVPEIGNLSLAQFKRNMFAGLFSSDPNDSYTGRYGFAKTSKDLGGKCPSYDLTKKAYDLDKIEQEMLNEVGPSPMPNN